MSFNPYQGSLPDAGVRAIDVPVPSGLRKSSGIGVSQEHGLSLPIFGGREAKISRLKRQISAGRYRISDLDLADKLIDTMLERF